MKLAHPFGLNMGMSLESIKSFSEEFSPYKFVTYDPPAPHPLFEKYILQGSPQYGLASVQAISEEIATNSYGTSLIQKFEELTEKIRKVYGSFYSENELTPGSIWDEPHEWMKSLDRKDRIVCNEWTVENGSELPSNLKRILVCIVANDEFSGYIAIDYQFINIGPAFEELDSLIDSVL